MEFETWWLLVIPLFFGLGWMASRLEQRGAPRERGQLPDAYFKGLNFLLNEQSDRAIDAFIDVVRIEPDTVELHFALGNLFRRRGETDRAIRVHQNLAERADLAAEQREHALYELGQDFLKAGLIDRAEDVFNRLEGSRYAASALRLRLEIAQRVRDWPAAIELAARLGPDGPSGSRREIAHFHCELAAQALAGSATDRFETCERELSRALAADPQHARAWAMRGEAALAEGRFDAALQAWRELSRVSPLHMALVATDWIRAHHALGSLDQGLQALEDMHRSHPAVDVFTALLRGRVERDGLAAATRWAQDELKRSPSLLGLDALLGMHSPTPPDAAGASSALGASLDLTLTSIKGQSQRLSRYVCGHCGFKARQFYWQCPGCSHWDAYAPRRGEELERG